ncbi:MAG: methylated-DNA-[protein]-cysteine S-methyltransferase [Arenicella sp.]|jgi:methylated-DNA-[protein]-cysteine S-methyltransferase
MSSTELKQDFETPFGRMRATVINDSLVRFTFAKEKDKAADEHPIFKTLLAELDSYFKGNLKQWSIPLAPSGTEFQEKVWTLLQEVEIGTTKNYLDLSKRYGDEKAIRALATANGANPICILIPCHRIIGSDGSLTAYAWGVEMKRELLQLEQKFSKTVDLFSTL